MKSEEVMRIKGMLTVVQCLSCDFVDTVLGVRRDYTRMRGEGFGPGRCNQCGSEAFILFDEREENE